MTIIIKPFPLIVKGYGIKLCDHERCRPDNCSNPRNSRYHVDEKDVADLARQCEGSPIVLNHQDDTVIGRVTSATYEVGRGLYIEGYVDDHHFLSHTLQSFASYSSKKDKINFLMYLKSLYPAFSLSSLGKEFQHVSLVITPARKGTNVNYSISQCVKRDLTIRDDNKNISASILGFASVYLTEPDRKYYLSRSQDTSLDPKNVSFLMASREPKMEEQQQSASGEFQIVSNEQQQQQPVQQSYSTPVAPPPQFSQEQVKDEATQGVVAHEHQPLVSTRPDQQPTSLPASNEQTLINIDREEYNQFLAFKEQFDKKRELENPHSQQQQQSEFKQPAQPDAYVKQPVMTSDLNDNNKRHSVQEDAIEADNKRQRIDGDVESRWQSRMDDMMNSQSETFKEMKTLIGSIRGFIEQNKQQQPQQQQRQQQQQQQPYYVEQPPPQQQQQKYQPYHKLDINNVSRPGIETMDRIMKVPSYSSPSSSVRFENDLLKPLKQSNGYHHQDTGRMVQANRELKYLDQHTFQRMFINDLLDRLTFSTKSNKH